MPSVFRHSSSKCVAIVAILSFFSLTLSGRASFLNGTETFDGTNLDTNTWETFSTSAPAPISQNSALIIGSAFQADYTTKVQTVGVGEKVGVDVKMGSGSGTKTY